VAVLVSSVAVPVEDEPEEEPEPGSPVDGLPYP
jgi:hypothetical protein